jgi:hypothetical protein
MFLKITHIGQIALLVLSLLLLSGIAQTEESTKKGG